MNFLYVTLEHLKKLEGEVLLQLESLGVSMTLEATGFTVDPHQFLGLEINPRAAAIAELASLGARSVLLEGGGRLNYAALKEKVVDELLITLVPSLSGDTDATSLVAGNGPLGSPFLPLTLVSAEPVSTGEIFLHYRRGDGHG